MHICKYHTNKIIIYVYVCMTLHVCMYVCMYMSMIKNSLKNMNNKRLIAKHYYFAFVLVSVLSFFSYIYFILYFRTQVYYCCLCISNRKHILIYITLVMSYYCCYLYWTSFIIKTFLPFFFMAYFFIIFFTFHWRRQASISKKACITSQSPNTIPYIQRL